MVQCSKTVNYCNYGFIPTGIFLSDLKGKLFGSPNLTKRLQAKDIMETMNIQPSDLVLDFGCGSGYMTVEMAKVAQKAYGIDVNDYIETIRIPPELRGRLEFIKTSGTQLPFQDHFFDKVLASEVLPMIPDPKAFLSEMERVLKSGGCLVIVNGGGHPAIKNAFEKRPFLLRVLQKIFSKRMPNSYEEYCSILQKSFKTAQDHFLNENEIRQLLLQSHFDVDSIDYTPGYWAGAYISWSQFYLYLKKGKTLSQRGFFFKYCLLTLLRRFEKRRYQGGILCIARKKRKKVRMEGIGE